MARAKRIKKEEAIKEQQPVKAVVADVSNNHHVEQWYMTVKHTATKGGLVPPGTKVIAADFPGGQAALLAHVNVGDVEVQNV